MRSNTDFDGDGVSDPTVWCPAASGNSVWKYLASNSSHALTTITLGSTGDIPVPGDFDGDGKTDPAVYRPSDGYFYVKLSGSSYTSATYGGSAFGGSTTTNRPVIGDYDGDGIDDFGIFQGATHSWFAYKSTTTFSTTMTMTTSFGEDSDIELPGLDWDGDGKADPAMYRPDSASWFVAYSGSAYGLGFNQSWGDHGDIPMIGMYAKCCGVDLAAYQPSTGVWKLLRAWAGYMPMFAFTFQWQKWTTCRCMATSTAMDTPIPISSTAISRGPGSRRRTGGPMRRR